MTTPLHLDASTKPQSDQHEGGPPSSAPPTDRQLLRWGGIAGLAGFGSLLGSVIVVVSLGLPDASDVETLTDFANIENGRIAEHFLYLGALMLFALHVLVLDRVLRGSHAAASLFGTALAWFGLVAMAASSLLHVSTAPLAELYTEPGASGDDRRMIEYAWHGAQSIFDTMLTTGVLLVPLGILLLGVAMRTAASFGTRFAWFTIAIGVAGTLGAAIAVIDPGCMASAAGVFAIAVFHLASGWRMLRHPQH